MPKDKTEQPAPEPNSQKNQLRQTLLTSSEGRLLLLGIVLAFIYTFWLAAELLFFPEDSQIFIAMTASEIIFGRAFCMAFGYSMGIERFTTIAICAIVETIFTLIFYPLFVFSWQHLLVIKWLKKRFERIRKAAEARQGIVRKYGIAGLFVFVWLPFSMTGPAVGSAIGYLIGLRTSLNMTVVLAGTYAAIFAWAALLSQFPDHMIFYGSCAVMALMALLVLIIITAHLLHRFRNNNKHKN